MTTSGKPLWAETWVSASAMLVGVTGISKALGFVRELLLANYLGASGQVDAYAVAYAIPLFLAGGIGYAFSTAVIPGYHNTIVRDGRAAGSRYLATTCVSAIVWSLIFLSPIWLFPESLAKLAAPWLPEPTVRLTVEMMGWLAVYVLIQNLVYVLSAVFHALNHFRSPAVSELFFNIVVIGVFVAAVARWEIGALVAGNLAGIVACGLVLIIGVLRKRGELPGISFQVDGVFRPLITFLPVLAYYFSALVPSILANYFASGLGEGSIAAFSYAKTLLSGIVTLVTVSVARGAFPTFAELSAVGEMQQLRWLVTGLAKLVVFVFLPISLAAFVYREPILRLVYQRGAFDEAALQLTAAALGFLALGLVFAAWEPIGTRALYAVGDTRSPLLATVGSLGVLLPLLAVLTPVIGLAGVALSLSLALAVDSGLQTLALGRRIRWPIWRDLAPFLAKCAMCALIATIPLDLLRNRSVADLLMGSLLFAGVYIGLVWSLVQPVGSLMSVTTTAK